MIYVISYLFLLYLCILRKKIIKNYKIIAVKYYEIAYIYIFYKLCNYKKLLIQIKTFHMLFELIDVRIIIISSTDSNILKNFLFI